MGHMNKRITNKHITRMAARIPPLSFAALVLIALVLATSVDAAIIQGEVYDLELNPANGVVIEVDTTPRQQLVALNGSYSVNVPQGSYTLTAVQKKKGVPVAQVSENITVAADGSYSLDLILFPIFTDTDEFNADVNLSSADVIATEQTSDTDYLPFIIGAALAAAIILFIVLKRRKRARPQASANPSGNDLDDLVSAIRKLGGRATQKELRKELPYSEAKVSLMLTDLEHKGVITKIKRGRANVVILK